MQLNSTSLLSPWEWRQLKNPSIGPFFSACATGPEPIPAQSHWVSRGKQLMIIMHFIENEKNTDIARLTFKPNINTKKSSYKTSKQKNLQMLKQKER